MKRRLHKFTARVDVVLPGHTKVGAISQAKGGSTPVKLVILRHRNVALDLYFDPDRTTETSVILEDYDHGAHGHKRWLIGGAPNVGGRLVQYLCYDPGPVTKGWYISCGCDGYGINCPSAIPARRRLPGASRFTSNGSFIGVVPDEPDQDWFDRVRDTARLFFDRFGDPWDPEYRDEEVYA